MQEFKQALADVNLYDLGFFRPKFTWCNGRSGDDFTMERRDRAVANGGWTNLFDVVEVQVLARCISDHNPLLVSFSNTRDIQWNKSRLFKYEASWSKMKDPQAVIKKVWRVKQKSNEPWRILKDKLSGCRKSLKIWVRKQVNAVKEQINQKEEELQSLQLQGNRDTSGQKDLIKEELNDLLEQEDLKWRQRAKKDWLRFGDRNQDSSTPVQTKNIGVVGYQLSEIKRAGSALQRRKLKVLL